MAPPPISPSAGAGAGAGANLFSAPPPPPPSSLNHPFPRHSPLPLPPRRNRTSKRPSTSQERPQEPPAPGGKNPAFRLPHLRTSYRKPVPGAAAGEALLAADPGDAAAGRAVVVGPSGVAFRMPGAPFDFQFSYSEAPRAAPLAIREPAFLPFAPPSMPRPWTGKAPLLSKKEKARKKGVRLYPPLGQEEPPARAGAHGVVMEVRGRRQLDMARHCSTDGRSREEVLGEPLTRAEVRALIRPHLSHNRQLNLGRDGLTHNMLEMIHCHWRRQEICKVRCRGVPTVDMKNICYHLEEKSGGKVIHRAGGVVFLYRGRHYDPRTRPRYPVMLWKPAAPVYPKLIQEAPEGLTKEEADEMRRKGQNLMPICKLAKNGIYVNLVKDVRNAFEGAELVKINCEGMHASDYKKLGAKLKELVPCVLLSFDNEQILIYRGKKWKSRYSQPLTFAPRVPENDTDSSSVSSGSDQSTGANVECTVRKVSSPKMLSLWKRAIDSSKALQLDDAELNELTPDSLLTRVEEFSTASQAIEHSFPALLVASGDEADVINAVFEEDEPHTGTVRRQDNRSEETVGSEGSDDDDDFDDLDSSEHFESSLPLGSLPIDSVLDQLGGE